MVLNRLKWKIGKPHPQVLGFKAGSGTTDTITALLTTITEQIVSATKYAVFLDLGKAFELANADVISDLLASKGVTGKLHAWLDDFIRDRGAKVTFQGAKSDEQTFDNGTPQGSILCPRLFNTLMEELVTTPLPHGITIYSYADDIVMVVSGVDALNRMTEALKTINMAIAGLGLKASPAKMKAMAFATPHSSLRLSLGDSELEWTKSWKYLGIVLDKMLTFKANCLC